jgi:hypothetical protein
MTDTNTNRPKSAPSHRLFNVTGDGDKARWINIGAAWPTKDSKGFTFVLSAIPVNGRIVMRVAEDKPAKKKGS